MSKKQHIVAQILRLIDQADENERAIVRDFLRTPRQRSKSQSPAAGAGKRSSRKQPVSGPPASTETEPVAATAAASGGD